MIGASQSSVMEVSRLELVGSNSEARNSFELASSSPIRMP